MDLDYPVVISLCDKTGNMVMPWAFVGYTCFCVDIQHSIRGDRVVNVGKGKIYYVWGDVRSWVPPKGSEIEIVFAFPPCTHLSSSGARDHKKKAGWMLADSLQLFDACYMAGSYSGRPFMIENPIGRLSTHRRAPDYKFQPWEYGDLYFKNTCLWTGNGFVMPPKLHTTPPPRHNRENMVDATRRRPSQPKKRDSERFFGGGFQCKRAPKYTATT